MCRELTLVRHNLVHGRDLLRDRPPARPAWGKGAPYLEQPPIGGHIGSGMAVTGSTARGAEKVLPIMTAGRPRSSSLYEHSCRD
jgi:hypothetical protein